MQTPITECIRPVHSFRVEREKERAGVSPLPLYFRRREGGFSFSVEYTTSRICIFKTNCIFLFLSENTSNILSPSAPLDIPTKISTSTSSNSNASASTVKRQSASPSNHSSNLITHTPSFDDNEYPIGIDGVHLALVFPFHIVLDRKLDVVQFGPSLCKLVPTLARQQPFKRYFQVTYPTVKDTWGFEDTRKW